MYVKLWQSFINKSWMDTPIFKEKVQIKYLAQFENWEYYEMEFFCLYYPSICFVEFPYPLAIKCTYMIFTLEILGYRQ